MNRMGAPRFGILRCSVTAREPTGFPLNGSRCWRAWSTSNDVLSDQASDAQRPTSILAGVDAVRQREIALERAIAALGDEIARLILFFFFLLLTLDGETA